MFQRSAPSSRLRRALLAGAAALACGSPLLAQKTPAGPAVIVAADFAGAAPGALPADWKALEFPAIKAHTRYAAVADPEFGQVVKATSTAAASGLVRKLAVDAHDYPILRWRWKVGNLIEGSDLTRKDGDDYAARIYVSFAYDPAHASLLERAWYGAARLIYGEYPPHSGLNYIWDAHAPVGTVADNPYTAKVKMFVVESGAARLGRWVAEERNILDDYRKAFGAEPPPVSGIAVMTDTDNTGGSAVAWYGNIELAKRR